MPAFDNLEAGLFFQDFFADSQAGHNISLHPISSPLPVGSFQMTKFPAQIDDELSVPSALPNNLPVPGTVFNKLRSAVISIQRELGANPSSLFNDVGTRFLSIETTLNNIQVISLSGDLGGSLMSPEIISLQGIPLTLFSVTNNQFLFFNGISFENKIFELNNLPNANNKRQVIIWNGTEFVFGNLDIAMLEDELEVVFESAAPIPMVNQPYQAEFSITFNQTPISAILSDSEGSSVNVLDDVLNNFVVSPNIYTKLNFGEFVDYQLYLEFPLSKKTLSRRITWGQPIYAGVSNILGLIVFPNLVVDLPFTVSTNKESEFNISSGIGEYIYIAFREGLGPVTLQYNNLIGGFSLEGITLLTNSFGFDENYRIYRSIYTNLTLDLPIKTF